MYLKLVAIACIFLGEALSIVAELIASKQVGAHASNYLWIFFGASALVIVGGMLLVAGYMLGYLNVKNIWIITAISVGSILIVEPIVAVLLFKQLPTAGALIGLVLGGLGIVSALMF